MYKDYIYACMEMRPADKYMITIAMHTNAFNIMTTSFSVEFSL